MEYKVGDKVKWFNHTCNIIAINTDKNTYIYCIKYDDYVEDATFIKWAPESELTLVEEETKSEPKFKVGDKVITDTNMKGKIIEVVEEGWYRVDFDDYNGISQPNSVVPEESLSIAEEENTDCEKCGLTRNSTRCLFMDNCPHNKQKNIIEIPKDWVLKDDNGNIINTTNIVLEKKKKEYPKTFLGCCDVLGIEDLISRGVKGYKSELLDTLQKLLICRDAYWKIAGEEMGLNKPWEPDWSDEKQDKYGFHNEVKYTIINSAIFVFPTPEMRDAFKKNFDPDIEICKKLL